MTMTFKAVKSNRLNGKGRYVARIVHTQKITTEQLADEINQRCAIYQTDVKAVLEALSHIMTEHLRDGSTVQLDGLGLFKIEAKSRCSDSAEEVTEDNIYAYSAHFIPESENRRPRMYYGLRAKKI